MMGRSVMAGGQVVRIHNRCDKLANLCKPGQNCQSSGTTCNGYRPINVEPTQGANPQCGSTNTYACPQSLIQPAQAQMPMMPQPIAPGYYHPFTSGQQQPHSTYNLNLARQQMQ